MTERRKNWDLPAREFARRETLERLERVLAEIERVSVSPGVDEVHDLRVSIRRFSQAVRIFEPLLPKRARKIGRQARALLAFAGAVRDLDVGTERLKKLGIADEDALLTSMNESRRRASLELLGEVYRLRAAAPEQHWPQALGGQNMTEAAPS
ncbi:MAG TPA: CHAD domain-containing protein [Bryobacteraceae bacterium]|nr:CHAD domain-containing protein [Bryobacteraceae bacterium]